MKHCILFVFAAFTCVASETNFSIRLENKPEPLMLHTNNGGTVRLNGARLFYKDEDEDMTPTEDGYLVQVINNRYPIIVDTLKGPVASIRLADADEIKGDELLVFYCAGAHQYGVHIYTIDGTEVTPFKTQPVSSNMHSVQIKGNEIVVKNEETDANGKWFISTDTYKVAQG